MQYKISTKIKLPTNVRAEVYQKSSAQKNAKPNQREKYPFSQMTAGQSFYVSNVNSTKSMNGSVYRASVKYGKTFVIRQEKSGLRIFCVA